MKKRLQIYLFMLVILVSQLAIAQPVSLTGTITDGETDDGLIGVSISIKGTTQGTVTDVNGFYQLNVPKGSTVLFSYIGYTAVEKQIVDVSNLSFAMYPVYESLGELIVIGYGVQRKSDKTGAVSHIASDDLNIGASTDPLQTIVGKASGVVVTKGGGNPTDDARIKIRGSAGISGATNTNPLYVIDGVPGADPNMVAPGNIESINILKDAASTAIYGSQGANGVIIITTKSGKPGEGLLSFSSTTSINQLANKIDLLSANKYKEYATKYGLNDIFVDGGAETDWQDEIYRTAISQQYNLSFSGGSEKSTYFASASHQDNEGIINQSSRKRTIGTLNLTHMAMDNKLTIKGGINVTFEEDHLVQLGSNSRDDIIYQTYRRNPTDPTHNEDGSIAYQRKNDNRGFDYVNPLGVLHDQTRMDQRKKVLGNISLNYEIAKGLNFKVASSYLSSDKEYTYFRPAGIYAGQGNDRGEGQRYYEVWTQKTLESTLNYATSFSNLHNIDAVLGYSWQENNFSKFGVNARNSQSATVGTDNMKSFLDLVYGDASSEANMARLIGFFGRVAYNYDNKYYIGGSIRTDGSSKFGENNKWGIFPTASLGWNLHNESFLTDTNWLSQLKLRASYGVAGNQSFGSYFSKSIFSPGDVVSDPISGNDVLVWSTQRNANPNLQWEQTAEYNIGVDFGILKNRISGSIEAYSKNTSNMLNEYSVPVPPNKYPKTWANSGSMTNKGIELYITAHVVDNKNLSWKTTVGASKNVGKITDLGEFWTEEDSKQGWISGQGIVGGDNWTMFVDSGQGIGNFFVYEYVGIEKGEALYLNRVKAKPNEPDSVKAGKMLTIEDRYLAGNATPGVELSWSNNFTFFNNWTLDFSFRGLFGQQVYNHTRAYYSSPIFFPDANVMESATKYMDQGFFGQFSVPSDEFIEEASFVRLDYLSLGYTLNFKQNNYIKNLKLSVMGNNLLLFTNYSGADPEMTIDGLGYGVDTFSLYPKSKTISFGVSATF